ncbi:MAG: hypothetical protein QM770_13515 [Tepidisphaeraceae bacterium]
MRRFRWVMLGVIALLLAATVNLAGASRVELKDGTVLNGEVKKMGGSYSVRLPDGSSKLISASQIKSIDGQPIGGATDGGGGATSAPASLGFASVKSKADRVEKPVSAVDLWQRFIKDNASSPDLDKAKAELTAWQKLYDDQAEKIKGKWVGGSELKELKKSVDTLVGEGLVFETDNQFSKAQKEVRGSAGEVPHALRGELPHGLLHAGQLQRPAGPDGLVDQAP